MTSSSSTPARVGEYDVFISHCGVDCKRDFAVWLKTELENVGIRCFFDEHSLEVGDAAAGKMLDAMKTATYGIVILSPGFFAREWCMKELQTFVRRGKIVPIFYGQFGEVQTARRKAIAGRVWTDFEKHVRTEEEYVAAASANTEWTGVRLAEEGWWSSCIRRVRDEVLRLLGKEKGGIRLSDDDLFVGQHEHLIKLKRLLGVPEGGKIGEATGGASGEVGIVGVKGMGGVGKSTLAKKLYDEPDVREWFLDGVCWLEVGPEPSDDKIRDLQRQVLAQTCNLSEDPGNPTRGRVLIRERLQGKRVLICLDDVWDDHETATPVVTPKDLGSGSRILKTSRVKEAVGGEVHDLDALDEKASWELFCWHAFGGERPFSLELMEAAERASGKCGGSPLAIKILGKHVAASTNKQECLADFLLLPRHSDAMVGCRSIIRRSYDNLPSDPPGLTDVFLLVAGLWLRTPDFSQFQIVVENIGAAVFGEEPVASRFLLARKALDKLVSRSLVDVEFKKEVSRDSYDDRYDGEILPYIRVHDLIVDTAEAIAEGGRVASRRFFRSTGQVDVEFADALWEHVRVQGRMNLESYMQPRSKVTSLVFDSGTMLAESVANKEGPSPCKLLVVDRGRVSSFGSLTKLLCLRLRGCTFEQVPEGLSSLEQLNVLEFDKCEELVALPASLGELKRLIKLKLHLCRRLAAVPTSIGQIAGLTQLELRECRSLTALPPSMSELKALKNVNLLRSLSLSALPESMSRLTSLTKLMLAGCDSLVALPEELGQLTALTELHLGWCFSLASLPESLGKLTRLTELHLESCGCLAALPDSVGLLVGVTMIDLSGCYSLAALPEPLGRLTSLTLLDLSGCASLEALPRSLDQLRGLRKLQLQWCKSLAALPELVGQLTESKELILDYCQAITALPRSVRQLTGLTEMSLRHCEALVVLPDSIGQLVGLTTLQLPYCHSLAALPDCVGLLTGLTELDLEGCKSLAALPTSVGLLTQLRMLNLRQCNSLAALTDSVGQLTGLTALELWGCESLTALPESVGQLTGLTQLKLRGCRSLATLPEPMSRLSGLTQLDLSICKSLAALPESTGQLTGLTKLNLVSCKALKALPRSLGNLTWLTELDLRGCESIAALPTSVGQLMGLKRLDLRHCGSLAALPSSLGQLTGLWYLDLRGCSSLVALPDSLGQLTGLKTLNLEGCDSLTALPDSIVRLVSENGRADT